MPLQRRLPKVGFRSAMHATRAEVTLDRPREGEGRPHRPGGAEVAASVVPLQTEKAKVILSGSIARAVTLQGPAVRATKGARAAIEQAGGKIEEGAAA